MISRRKRGHHQCIFECPRGLKVLVWPRLSQGLRHVSSEGRRWYIQLYTYIGKLGEAFTVVPEPDLAASITNLQKCPLGVLEVTTGSLPHILPVSGLAHNQ
jgi:hypothetical protein